MTNSQPKPQHKIPMSRPKASLLLYYSCIDIDKDVKAQSNFVIVNLDTDKAGYSCR